MPSWSLKKGAVKDAVWLLKDGSDVDIYKYMVEKKILNESWLAKLSKPDEFFKGRPKSIAVVIGINEYDYYKNLETAAADADKMVSALQKSGFDEIILMKNEVASKKAIEHIMIDYLPNKLTKDDRLLFYFSGHGSSQAFGRNGELPVGYLQLSKSTDKRSTMISMNDFREWYTYIAHAKQSLFLIDSCMSGLAGVETKYSESLGFEYGHFLVTAGKADERVFTHEKWNGSLFTDSFVKAISGAADTSSAGFEKDNIITLSEVDVFISRYIKLQLSTEPGRKMTPQFRELSAETDGDFFFIRASDYLDGDEEIVYTTSELGFLEDKSGKFNEKKQYRVDSEGLLVGDYTQGLLTINYNYIYKDDDFNVGGIDTEDFLSSHAVDVIRDVALYIEDKGLDVQLIGHTDQRGTPEHNLSVGNLITDLVKDYLILLGVRSEKITTVSYGEYSPVSPGITEYSMAMNRRLQFEFTKSKDAKDLVD